MLCFKAEMTTERFFGHIVDQALLADKHGVSLLMLHTLIDQMKRDIENLKKEKEQLKIDTENEVRRQGATMNLLREYQVEKPLLDSTRMQLEKAVKERDSCRSELDSVRKEYNRKVWEEKEKGYSWYADPSEEEKANSEFICGSFEEDYTRWLREP